MSEEFGKAAEQIAAFQKIWMESFTQLMQTAFTSAPNVAPPELMRQMRSGIFRSLSQSWDEFLRSPQFLNGMGQWMEGTINFRKNSNEWMARMRNELQAPSRDDIDSIMLSVRHMEQRLLDRMEELSKRIQALNGNGASGPKVTQPENSGAQRAKSPRKNRPANGKVKTK
jgi:hypothetical protein